MRYPCMPDNVSRDRLQKMTPICTNRTADLKGLLEEPVSESSIAPTIGNPAGIWGGLLQRSERQGG